MSAAVMAIPKRRLHAVGVAGHRHAVVVHRHNYMHRGRGRRGATMLQQRSKPLQGQQGNQ